MSSGSVNSTAGLILSSNSLNRPATFNLPSLFDRVDLSVDLLSVIYDYNNYINELSYHIRFGLIMLKVLTSLYIQ